MAIIDRHGTSRRVVALADGTVVFAVLGDSTLLTSDEFEREVRRGEESVGETLLEGAPAKIDIARRSYSAPDTDDVMIYGQSARRRRV